eukprot:s2263_g1.t1
MTQKKIRKLPRPQDFFDFVKESQDFFGFFEESKSQHFFVFFEESKSQDFFGFFEESKSQDFFGFFEESLREGLAESVPDSEHYRISCLRLLHAEPGDPPFGTYDTVEGADGNFHSTLQLTERAQKAARLKKREYEGEVCSTGPDAETSAARLFWDDPRVQDRAKKLPPSRKARKQKQRCAQRSEKRKAQYGYGTGVERIHREDRKGSTKEKWAAPK